MSRVESWIECLDCGEQATYEPISLACPACGSTWREARYGLRSLRETWQRELPSREPSLWRYGELLPIRPDEKPVMLGEGMTPLLEARQLGEMLRLPHLMIKDERQGPTHSFKDRQAAVSVNALRLFGLQEAVVCSTGNVALAYSAFCARAGIKLWAFLTSLVPPEKMHEVAVYGTEVIKVAGTYDQAKQLAAAFAESRGLYLDRGARSIATLESMKTIAFEICEQLAGMRAADSLPWPTPDWYIQAVSGGIGPLGVLKGFFELRAAGLIEKIPKIACVQADGCAPMARAWASGRREAVPVRHPETYITTLTTGDPGRAYSLLFDRLTAGPGGIILSVSDQEAFHALHLVAKLEGLSIEPAAAVAFAGLLKMARDGIVSKDELIVVNCSGHAVPVERQMLPAGWATELDLEDSALPARPREGLSTALRLLERRRMRQVLVVDDQADARRLIRRLLEAHGAYEVCEASGASQALEVLGRRPMDLIILDLMMPETDGFDLVERLKRDEALREVPIIVVTAKELTHKEWQRLSGKINRLMVKGDFLDDELVREIDHVLS